MIGVLAGFTVIGIVILVGYIAGRLQIGGPAAPQALTGTAFFLTNPALLLTVVAEADLTDIFSAYVPVAVISALGTAALFILASRLFFRRPAPETAIGAMSSSYVNANNIGLPIAVYALGDATPVVPVLLLQLLVLAPAYLALFDLTSGHPPSVGRIISQPVRNPMIIASFLGVALSWSGVTVPAVLWEPLLLLGGAAVPLVLLAFGMSLRGNAPLASRANRVDVMTATVLKSVVMPVIAYVCAAHVFHLDDQLVFGAVLMAALPAAQNVFMFASRYGQGVPTARDVVVLSSAAAVPVLLVAAAFLA
ncbi:AEC family transporter [Arthrobacter sp. NamB2]|uniref:AEC family transporter n=1 Tax=Arthrobacter sp. NamB2 TaxID=2576035 RepID=UPI0010C99291|nr:AEC family transporter [Arthrobacter sp. NamB2]TKV28793.1 AEC family transporter [Arthrobacter sp. NamB2]